MDTPLPVIRVFGSTDKGQRICANIHGVLPYIYMRPESMTNTIFESEDKVKRFLVGIEKTLEDLLNAKRMKAAANNRPANADPNKTFRRRRHIHALEIVYHKTIYGMYTEPHIFVKVVLRDPGDITKIATVLDETALGGISMMTYESHIPYLLKFTSDYNVTPMGWLHLSQAKFRSPLPSDEPIFPPPVLSNTTQVDSTLNQAESVPGEAMSTPSVDITPTPDATIPLSQKSSTLSTPKPKLRPNVSQLFLSPTHVSPPLQSPQGSAFSSVVSPAAVKSVEGQSSIPSIPKHQPGYFTQSTTPAHFIWGSPTPQQANEVIPQLETDSSAVIDPESFDVAALMEGITEETFVWSQLENGDKQPPLNNSTSNSNSNSKITSNSNSSKVSTSNASNSNNGGVDVSELNLLEKESCCELEIDIHISHIMNSQMKKIEFGAELWEEEKIRCAQLGQEIESVMSQPSTQTIHRTKQPVELGFIDRYHSLVQKGEALRKVGNELMESQSYPHSEVLSRYLSVQSDSQSSNTESQQQAVDSQNQASVKSEETSELQSKESQRLTQESVDLWVSQRLKEVEDNALLDEELVQEYLNDPQVSLNAYVQSQRDEEEKFRIIEELENNANLMLGGIASEEYREEQLATAKYSQTMSQQQYRPTPMNSKVSYGIADEDEEEGSDWVTQCETNDILTSTQVNADGEIEEKTKNIDVKAVEPLILESVDMFPDSFFNDVKTIPVIDTNSSASRSRPPLIPRKQADASDFTPLPYYQHNNSSSSSGRISPGYSNSASNSDSDSDSISTLSRKKSINVPAPVNSTIMFGESSGFNYSPHTPSPLLRSGTIESEITSDGERSDSSMSYESILSVSGKKRKRPRQSVRFEDSVEVIQEKKRRKSVSFNDRVSVIEDKLVDGTPRSSSLVVTKAKGIAVMESPIKVMPTPPVPSQLTPRVLIEISSDDEPKRKPKVVIEISSDDDEESISLKREHRDASRSESLQPEGIASVASSYSDWVSEPGDVVHQPLYYSNPADAKIVSSNSETARMMQMRHPVGVKLDLDSFDTGVEITDPTQRKDNIEQSQIPTPTQTPFTAAIAEDLSMKVGAGANVIKRSSRLTILSCEIHCNSRANFLPNPKHDEVQAIFWVVDDLISNCDNETTNRLHGVICQVQQVEAKPTYARKGPSAAGVPAVDLEDPTLETRIMQQKMLLSSYGLPEGTYLHVVPNEQELFLSFINTIFNIDPDFLVGYEVQNNSFGYLVKRGKVIGIDMLQAMSKMYNEKPSYRNDMTDILDGQESGLFVAGRLILNMWLRMKEELKLFNYSYSNVTANLLEKRVPYFTPAQLTRWYKHQNSRGRTVRHIHKLAELNLILIEKIDLIRKTSESARLYGIDFFSVLSRGSQYRVEASLLIKAHAFGFIMMSPSRQKVAAQAPMECIPLVMEPQSQFFEDPVVVLDYQSLYPSMMIAHNLCFSTIMGKLAKGTTGMVETTERLGACNYSEVQSAMCATLHSRIANHNNNIVDAKTPYIAPNGSVFCSKNVRMGILPLMVKEMLETRQMIKRSMKKHKGKGSIVLQKVLDARQLAIKLLSNVTYGYTAAGFSGRMPMAELADAIVQSGRSLLEWTHDYINKHPTWRAKVVYGDTDSVFVQLKGRTKDAAFQIGQQMSSEISAKCPKDVFLKFEKVYLPSILVTKKRYVGNMFETITQVKPNLDAKGIEVVRRDQCPATVKMQEKCIRIMFECKDLSKVKHYLFAQWDKMLQGGDKLLLKDFIFSKEVRFGHYATVSSQPPGAIVATKAVLQDEMATPPYNWRVPYVVVNGVPNALLKHLVYTPEEVMRRGSSLRLNYTYYITKCINPSLDRILSLCGADVFAWFKSMPRPKLRLRHINYDAIHAEQEAINVTESEQRRRGGFHFFPTNGSTKTKKKQTLMDQFTVQGCCSICGNDSQPQKTLCTACGNNKLKSTVMLLSRLNTNTQKEQDLASICNNCSKGVQPSKLYSKGDITGPDCCESLDCQIFYERGKLVTRIEDLYTAVHELEEE